MIALTLILFGTNVLPTLVSCVPSTVTVTLPFLSDKPLLSGNLSHVTLNCPSSFVINASVEDTPGKSLTFTPAVTFLPVLSYTVNRTEPSEGTTYSFREEFQYSGITLYFPTSISITEDFPVRKSQKSVCLFRSAGHFWSGLCGLSTSPDEIYSFQSS